MAFQVTVKGLDKLERKLSDEKARPYLLRALRKSTVIVRDIVRKYPPKRSPKHRRTGTLGKGWKAQVSDTGNTARAINPVRYAHIVHGGRQVSRWHKQIGWVQTKNLVKDRMVRGRVLEAFNEQLKAYTREVNR